MKPFQRILVPVDFSSCSREALRQGIELARLVGGTVDVLHSWSGTRLPPPPASAMANEAFEEVEAVTKTRSFVAELDSQGVEIGQRVEYGSPAEVIIAASPSYSLIVMGTHGRTGLSRLVMGSVASRVASLALCPVLTVKGEHVREEHIRSGKIKPNLRRHPDEKVVYALLDKPSMIERALGQLLSVGISVDDVSVLMTEETHERDFPALFKNQALKGAATGGVFGGTLGGILGGLTLLGAVTSGGAGLVVMGPALAFAAVGGLFGGLVGWGVPQEEAQRLQTALHEGKALMAVHLRDTARLKAAQEIFRGVHGETVELAG